MTTPITDTELAALDAAMIPPPTDADRAIDFNADYRYYGSFGDLDKSCYSQKQIAALIRRCHHAEQSLAAIRDTLRGVLGTEPCGHCGGDPYGAFSDECPCHKCRGTGTRDIIDSLTTEEAVGRALKELNEEADFAARASIRDSDRIATVEAERDTLAARAKQAEELLRPLLEASEGLGPYAKYRGVVYSREQLEAAAALLANRPLAFAIAATPTTLAAS